MFWPDNGRQPFPLRGCMCEKQLVESQSVILNVIVGATKVYLVLMLQCSMVDLIGFGELLTRG